MLFEFIHEALHPLISLCQCMSKISAPQTAIALDEETDGIVGGNLDYGLRTGVKSEQQGDARQTIMKKIRFQLTDRKKEKGSKFQEMRLQMCRMPIWRCATVAPAGRDVYSTPDATAS
jgi:hypothetical protein